MKRIITLFTIAAISLTAFAQKENSPSPDHKKHHERFQAEKVAFLTQKMDLTVTEAEAFWPIYNEYSKATGAVHKEMMAAVDKINKSAEISDAEAEAAINALLAAQKKDTELKEQFTARFKKVLPVKKVAAFFAAEDAFRRHLFRKFKDGSGFKGQQFHGDRKGFKGPKGPKDSKEPKDKTQK